MNPMRSAGPAIVAGTCTSLWIYLVAPPIGAAIGALAYQFIRGEPAPSSPQQQRARGLTGSPSLSAASSA